MAQNQFWIIELQRQVRIARDALERIKGRHYFGNPANVAALIAECDRLRARNTKLEANIKAVVREMVTRVAAHVEAECSLRAERDEARKDQKVAEDSNDALNEKLVALTPHGSCACSYDRPGDVCLHHSPALAVAEARIAELEAERDAAREALKPFARYAEHHPSIDFGDGHVGEYYHGGIRIGISMSDLRGARTALAQPEPPPASGGRS